VCLLVYCGDGEVSPPLLVPPPGPQRINPCPLTCRQYIKLLATRPAWAKETLSCARERVAGRDIGVGAGVGVDVDVVVGMLFPLLSLQLVRLSSASGVLVVAFELSHGHLASCPGKKCKSFVYIGHSRNPSWLSFCLAARLLLLLLACNNNKKSMTATLPGHGPHGNTYIYIRIYIGPSPNARQLLNAAKEAPRPGDKGPSHCPLSARPFER